MERAELTVTFERERRLCVVDWEADFVVWEPFSEQPIVEIIDVRNEAGTTVRRALWVDVLEECRDAAIDQAQTILIGLNPNEEVA